MTNFIHSSFLVLGYLFLAKFVVKSAAQADAPMIGVFAQPVPGMPELYYVSADYSKWLESGGARVLPIPFNASEEVYDYLFEQINGLLLPGGNNPSADVLEGMGYMVQKAIAANNEAGQYFPVWGTCQGLQLLLSHQSGEGVSVLQKNYAAENISLPLENIVQKELFIDSGIYNAVKYNNITFNSHTLGITPDAFMGNPSLTSLWSITSTNTDLNGVPFVSTLEPVNPGTFPVYATQWHPEKNGFQFAFDPNTTHPHWNIPHTLEAVTLSTHLAQFFVDKARRNLAVMQHQYDDPVNCPPLYTYAHPPADVAVLFQAKGFQEVYLFSSTDLHCGFSRSHPSVLSSIVDAAESGDNNAGSLRSKETTTKTGSSSSARSAAPALCTFWLAITLLAWNNLS